MGADHNSAGLSHTGLPKQMKRVLFAAATLAVLSIGANAHDQLPANLVGDWCFAEHTADHLAFYRRGRCANPDNVDDWLTINPESFDIHEMHCQVLVARANKRGDYCHRHHPKHPPPPASRYGWVGGGCHYQLILIRTE